MIPTTIDTIISVVVSQTGVPREDLASTKRGATVAQARELVSYIATARLQATQEQIAEALLGSAGKHSSIAMMLSRARKKAGKDTGFDSSLASIMDLIGNSGPISLPERKAIAPVDKLRLLADVVLVNEVANGHGTTPILTKAVLTTIAGHEGEMLSYAGIAARCNCDPTNTISRALVVLIRNRLIVQHDNRAVNRPATYTVDWDRVAEMGSREPTFRIAGGKARSNNYANTVRRMRRRALREAAARRAG